MERSLRACGNRLPVWVIPYDNEKFDLPENCIWWEEPQLIKWVDNNKLWPAFKKIQCLTISNYQFVDSDVIFCKDPSNVLLPTSGFITSCTHWNNPGHTYTAESLRYLKKKSTTWQKLVFNSGQFACDRALYSTTELMELCTNQYVDTLFKDNYKYKDQAAINLLVNLKDISITNLTLPPVNMESTWAGDYLDPESFHRFERKDKPYIIHWAGTPINSDSYIHSYFFKYLSPSEKHEYSINSEHSNLMRDVREKLRKVFHFIQTF